MIYRTHLSFVKSLYHWVQKCSKPWSFMLWYFLHFQSYLERSFQTTCSKLETWLSLTSNPGGALLIRNGSMWSQGLRESLNAVLNVWGPTTALSSRSWQMLETAFICMKVTWIKNPNFHDYIFKGLYWQMPMILQQVIIWQSRSLLNHHHYHQPHHHLAINVWEVKLIIKELTRFVVYRVLFE